MAESSLLSSSSSTFLSSTPPITKNAIQRMLYYPYRNNADTTTRNLRRFRPIVQVLQITREEVQMPYLNNSNTNNNSTKNKQPKNRGPCLKYVMELSDSVVTIKAILDSSRTLSSSGSRRGESGGRGSNNVPRLQDLKPCMFITIHDFTPISTCDDGHYLIVSSFRIHSCQSSLSLPRQPQITSVPQSVNSSPNHLNLYILNVAAQYIQQQPIYDDIDYDDDDYAIPDGLWNGHGCGYEGAVVIAQTIQHHTDPASTLSMLDLSYNFLGNSGIQLLVQAFPSLPRLQWIDLSNSKISYKGVAALAEYMKQSTGTMKLRKLNLDHNSIGDRGITVLADALQGHDSQLQELRLDENKITAKGIQALANALITSNKSMKRLWLEFNNLGDDGMIAIATLLRYNMTLEVLYLRSTNIGNIGLVALADALKYNTGLEEINLDQNVYNETGVLSIYRALEYNPALQTLKLDARKFDYSNFNIISPRKYDSTMVEIIRTMLCDYNDKLQTLDDPMLPFSLDDLFENEWNSINYRYYHRNIPFQKYRKRKGQHQRMDMYQWLLQHPTEWMDGTVPTPNRIWE